MTKTESAHLTAQTVLLESAEQVLQLQMAAGVRLAIPNTDALIMVGPADWIAKNVPGVEAMVAAGQPDAMQNIAAMVWQHALSDAAFYVAGHCANGEHYVDDIMSMRMPKITFAATTQASTAQAEPAKFDPDDLSCLYPDATSSTDAQAAAEVRDAWISVDDRLPECSKKPGSLGVEVIVYPRPEKGESTAFFGCRLTDDPDFYKYGSRVGGVTHWMPLPAAPSALRAGDTGEQADGGAAK